MTTAAIILAAGGSRRFGSGKQLALLDERPMLQHVIDAAVAAPSLGQVIVVVGARADEVLGAIELARAEPVVCPNWSDGQSRSLQAGAAAVAPDVDRVMVLLGDQPRVSAPLIERILAVRPDDPSAVLRATYRGVRAHPVTFGDAVLRRLPALTGDTGARDLLAGLPSVDIEVGDVGDASDVDTVEQLAALTAAVPATALAHVDSDGSARMVGVTDKAITVRRATARASVVMSVATARMVAAGDAPKGDVLGVARIAGILAAKQTAALIPLCHPLPLNHVDIDGAIDAAAGRITLTAEASTRARTGVEMEAMTAATVAALTVYDMVKGLDKGVTIEAVALLEKHGGRSGSWTRQTG